MIFLKKPKRGFVLVSVLLVLCLLSIIVIGSLVVSQIEQKAQYNASRLEVARQNALVGLNQALDQLQTAAGPDQRVTARADILSPNNPYPPHTMGYNADTPGTDIGQGFWTGVWKNTLNDYSGPHVNTSIAGYPPNPFLYYDCLPTGIKNNNTTGATPNRQTFYNLANVTWLISWPYSSTFTAPPDPTSNITSQLPTQTGYQGTTTVALAKNLGTNNPLLTGISTLAGQPTTVSAPVVPLNSTAPVTGKTIRVGSYAYWVADEGIKAKADVPDPYIAISPATSLPKNGAHFASALSPAVSHALVNGVFSNASSATDPRPNPLYAPTLAALTYADTSSNPSSWVDFSNATNTYFPDFTVSSYGVLADNFNGGLRQDLTAAFENPSSYWQLFGDKAPPATNEALRKLYSVNALVGTSFSAPVPNKVTSGANQYVFDGLRWDSLFFYYNLYKNAMPSPLSSNLGSAPGWSSGPPFSSSVVPTLYSRVYEEPGFTIDPIAPQVVSWAMTVGFQLIKTAPNTYQVQLTDIPLAAFINPFNVNLQAPKSTGGKYAGMNLVTNVGGMDQWTFEVYNKTGTTLVSSTPATYFGEAGSYMNIEFGGRDSSGNPEPNLLPGEIRAYSYAGTTGTGSGDYTLPSSYATSSNNPTVSWSPDNGVRALTAYLQSKNIVAVNSPVQTVQPAALTLTTDAFDTSDILKIKGGSRLRANVCYVQTQNFLQWPSSTTNYGTIYSNNLNDPSIGVYNPGGQVPYGQVGSFTGVVQPVALYFDRAYGLSSPNATNYNNFAANPQNIPPTSAYGLNWLNVTASLSNRDYSSSVANSGVIASPTEFQVAVAANSMTDTGWGPNSSGATTQNSQVPLKDIPRQPMQSLGQLRNMLCAYFPGFGSQQDLSFSFNPIGGSYEGGVGPNLTFIGVGNNYLANRVYLDDNFLGNEALFDSYFLSTVPPVSGVSVNDISSWPITPSNFNQAYVNTNQPLPNSRLVYYIRQNNPNHPANSIYPNYKDLQGGTTTPVNLRLPSANLLINGAFNINSTSVAAWQAQLSALSGSSPSVSVNRYNSSTGALSNSLLTLSSTESPFFNFLNVVCSSASVASIPSGVGSRSAFLGFLRINDTDINSLAKAIVTEIRARGPAFSLGDFLNRRLDTSDTALSTRGVLQAAIDNTPTINSSVTTALGGKTPSRINQVPLTYTTPVNGAMNYPYVPGNIGCVSYNGTITTLNYTNPGTNPSNFNTASCLPGTLSQYDLVQALAPVITARSDTFTIRAYGDAVNPSTGAIEGKAWCEATVQRVPEYEYSTETSTLDSSGKSNYAYDNPNPLVTNTEQSGVTVNGLTSENYAFGRRFKIIAFRWLNSNEI